MSVVKISYVVEGLNQLDKLMLGQLQGAIEYQLPERELVEAAAGGLKEALRGLLSHPGVAQMVKALEGAEVRIQGDMAFPSGPTRLEETLPIGRQLKQLYRLAQAKLGV